MYKVSLVQMPIRFFNLLSFAIIEGLMTVKCLVGVKKSVLFGLNSLALGLGFDFIVIVSTRSEQQEMIYDSVLKATKWGFILNI